jgi:hypothetical protein
MICGLLRRVKRCRKRRRARKDMYKLWGGKRNFRKDLREREQRLRKKGLI